MIVGPTPSHIDRAITPIKKDWHLILDTFYVRQRDQREIDLLLLLLSFFVTFHNLTTGKCASHLIAPPFLRHGRGRRYSYV